MRRRRFFFLSADATVEMPPPVAAPKLFDAELPQRQMLLDPILSNDTMALLYGPRGLGKTFVALGMAWAAASGSSFLNWHAGPPLQDRRPRLLEVEHVLALVGAALLALLVGVVDQEYGPAAAAIRRPADYQPAEGVRFEIHFEKARCLFGEAAKPIEAPACKSTRRASRPGTGGRSTTTISTASWSCSKLGLNAPQVARELGISRSQSYRLLYHLLTHARQFDMLRR